jgi:hypothetical protein
VPEPEEGGEAVPQVPQRGGGLTRADVRVPLLGSGKAVLVFVLLMRQWVNHRSSIWWEFEPPFGPVYSDDERDFPGWTLFIAEPE